MGGTSTSSGGSTFADVLSSSYGLTLNDFRSTDDSSRDSGGGLPPTSHAHNLSSQPCDTYHDTVYSQPSGESADSSAVASAASSAVATAASSGHGNNPACFGDTLDTFHAEFITQPIDYPIDVSPPPPIPLQNTNCTNSGSPNTCHPGSMSPGLPSFLDTYRHPVNIEQGKSDFEGQTRFTGQLRDLRYVAELRFTGHVVVIQTYKSKLLFQKNSAIFLCICEMIVFKIVQ